MSPLHSKPKVLRAEDVHAGRLYWLREKSEVVASLRAREPTLREPVISIHTGEPLDEGMFKHPFLDIGSSGKPYKRLVLFVSSCCDFRPVQRLTY